MDGIVLLAKKPGITSFNALNDVKKALDTKKVGHTGTLDSFAQGLLVACCGRLTRLAGNITEFDKTYIAAIKFGEETDTLEYTGNVVRQEKLPTEKKLYDSINKFTGILNQYPPAFSAIHINGKRASDLARKGIETFIPPRQIIVYNSEVLDVKINQDKCVEACLVKFRVSKGTYIRCLARDIAIDAGSAAHLIGLFRTEIGKFSIKDASGENSLPDFTIEDCLKISETYKSQKTEINKNPIDLNLQKEIKNNIFEFDKELSLDCGFYNLDLISDEAVNHFCNGKPICNKLFVQNIYDLENDKIYAVFHNNNFFGLIEKKKNEIGNDKFYYKFVNN